MPRNRKYSYAIGRVASAVCERREEEEVVWSGKERVKRSQKGREKEGKSKRAGVRCKIQSER